MMNFLRGANQNGVMELQQFWKITLLESKSVYRREKKHILLFTFTYFTSKILKLWDTDNFFLIILMIFWTSSR